MCLIHRSYDPVIHITMDSTKEGVCQLNFALFTDSCADVSPIVFGMKVEVDMTTVHDASTLLILIRFNNNGGSVYYNEDEPWETVFLHYDIPPGRKLYGSCNFNCDPMSPYDDTDQGCQDGDCASDTLKDGCLAWLCYNQGNTTWCDGTKSVYYDNYFQEHKQNPFGDSNYSNRKCNTYFTQLVFIAIGIGSVRVDQKIVLHIPSSSYCLS